jgi:hypothetical protein
MQVLAALAALVATALAGVEQDVPWDPRGVDDLPAADVSVAPLLPDVLVVPPSAPRLADRPLRAAVLTVREDDALYLLGVDGSWRSVPPPAPGDSAELTRDGTRLAVERPAGVDVWDLRSGEQTRWAAPRQHRPWDYTAWRWVDDDTLLLDDLRGGWKVDTLSGSADRVPYPLETSYYWTVDADGAVVESADWGHPSVLTDWAGGVQRSLAMAPTGRLATLRADADTVVGTSYELRPFAVYVADRLDLTPRHVLPVLDHEGNYSNGGLSVLALLSDGTVLLRVSVFGGPEMSWRLVAWDPRTDSLAVVTRAGGTVPLWSVAADLLG